MRQISAYLSWHYRKGTKKILKLTNNFLKFFYHFFSIDTLAKTFFAPWKREYIKLKSSFPLSQYFEAATFNLISRALGAIIRLIFIIFSIFVLLITTILGLFVLFLWLITPGASLPIYFLTGRPKDKLKKILKKTKGDPIKTLLEALKTAEGQFLLARLNLDLSEIQEHLRGVPPAGGPPSEVNSASPAQGRALSSVKSLAELFFFLAKNYSPFNQFLSGKEISPKDVYSVCLWFERWQEEEQRKARFWELENLLKIPGVGRDWAFGYTINLDRYTTDLTTPLPYYHKLVGRKKEVSQIEQVLARALENNVLLIGQPGVGRHTIIRGFAKKVYEGKINPLLARKRVLSLNIPSILSEEKSLREAKGKLEAILLEAAEAGNIILVIDNFDKYVSSSEGRYDLTDVFSKIIKGRIIQVIGITTPADFQKYIFPNQEILKLFEKVEVFPPSKEEAIKILQNIVPVFERKEQVFATYQALLAIIEKAERFVSEIPFPEKAIDLLDEALIFVAQKKGRVLTVKDVDLLLSQKTKIPIGKIALKEKEKLKNLETILHKRIVNQEKAVKEIASAMRRARLEIGVSNRPIGSFLFLGPTGVGKTETAKALASSWFGRQEKMIRLDMSEYQTRESMVRLIGDFKSKEPGILAQRVRENPFSLLLLDEIEKAKGEVLNLFLSILEDGFFTDAFGKRVFCRNLIIIGTSNAGAEFIREKINEGIPYEDLRSRLLEFVQKEKIFSPEFLNRFDGVVVFKPLTKESLKAIAHLMLENLNKRLAKKKISVKITEELIDIISTLGFNPQFGARPMRRVIQEKIEDYIARGILDGTIKKGEKIEINL